MGGADVGAAVGGAAEDDRAVDQAAGHVADVGGVVEDLVEGDGVEAEEHQFHDRTQAEHRGADAHADEPGLADRRVDDAFRAVLGQHALGDLVGAVELGDFLAQQDDVRVALDFLGHGGPEGFAVGDDGHGREEKVKVRMKGEGSAAAQSKNSAPSDLRSAGLSISQ